MGLEAMMSYTVKPFNLAALNFSVSPFADLLVAS